MMSRRLHGALVCASLTLSACSPLDAAKVLTSGKSVNTAASVQAGKTNAKTIGSSEINSQKLVRPEARSIEQSAGDTKVRSERVETVVVHEKDSTWLILSLALAAALAAASLVYGWLTPSPREGKLRRRLKQLEDERIRMSASPEIS